MGSEGGMVFSMSNVCDLIFIFFAVFLFFLGGFLSVVYVLFAFQLVFLFLILKDCWTRFRSRIASVLHGYPYPACKEWSVRTDSKELVRTGRREERLSVCRGRKIKGGSHWAVWIPLLPGNVDPILQIGNIHWSNPKQRINNERCSQDTNKSDDFVC